MADLPEAMTADPPPVVSVCIANYNGIGVIDACIESVRAQTFALPIEIIVHDDASQDRSAAHIRDKYPDVILLESADNVGFCVSNNRMVERARGQYILLLNNDAELFPDALERLYWEAATTGGPAILGLPQYDADNGELLDRGSLLDPFLNPVPNLDPQRRDVGLIIGACLWIPRTLWDELGGLPEWFESIGEDLYLCCQARLWEYPVRVVSESGFRHHSGSSFGGGKLIGKRMVTTVRRRTLSERNKSFVMATCYPAVALAIVLPLHAVLLLLEGVALALVKWDFGMFRDIYLSTLAALWKQRARLVAERRRAQSARLIGVGAFFRPFSPLPHKLRMLWRHGIPQVDRR